MGVVVHSRGMLPGIGMVATICVAACSASPAPSGAVPRNHETTRPAATAAVNPTPSAAASATPAAQPGVQNLVIPSAEKSELTATFAGYEATSPSGVLGGGPWLYQRANFSPDGTQQVVPACSEIQWFPPAVLMAWSMPTAPPAGVTC